MAIWPFGRKVKRQSSQLAGAETVEKILSSSAPDSILPRPEHGSTLPSRKPSRKRSKRRKNRPLVTPDEFSNPEQDATLSPVRRPKTSPQTMFSDQHPRSMKAGRDLAGHRKYPPSSFDDHTSHSSIGQDQLSVSRAASLLRRKPSGNGPTVLKKKLSKRKANQISREREIRAMSSSPITISKRTGVLNGQHNPWDVRRGGSALSGRSDRPTSDLSLPMRDSPGSSMTDGSESYTFKVNAFAAWTPRPAIRYSEPPRYHLPRSQGPSVTSNKRSTIPEEDLNPRKRIEELADDLDAGALRELMERDRRRREKKRLADHEKLQRRLQRRADRQREEERQREEQHQRAAHGDPGADEDAAEDRRKGSVDTEMVPSLRDQNERGRNGNGASKAPQQPGSWLRDPSKDSQAQSNRASLASAHVVGTLDDSSIRASKSGQRRSVALSQEMQISRSTISPCHSPVRQGPSGASMPQLPGAPESTSDLSRTVDSERRLSDNSGKRTNLWSSFFRRGGSRLKRGSWERGQGPPSEFSNTSKESFSKVQQPPSGHPPAVPPRTFLRTGTVKRSQSKFTEHLGDYPISPPDSRLQSPDIPETILDMSPPPQQTAFRRDGEQNLDASSPIGCPGPGRCDDMDSRPRSWEASSPETGPETGPEVDPDGALFSQSLASVDSEGSWMSGKYLRLSQQPNSSIRRSVASTSNRLEGYAESREADDVTGDEYFTRLTPSHDENRDSLVGARRASSSAMGAESDGDSDVPPMAGLREERGEPEETWHTGIGRRPTVIRPTERPKSKSGLLNDVQTWEPPSPEEENSPVDEEPPPEIRRATSVDLGRGHARHVSAGSAKLLDIPPRTSTDSKPLSSGSTMVGDVEADPVGEKR